MKKILLLGCVLLYGSVLVAEVAATNPTTTIPEKAVISTETPMEWIARNIDRRLIYLNRYKKSEDMESLAKLVSDENKDFYINFMNYMKASAAFTLKRDPAVRIIKTPTEEYVISAIMSVDGKEKKVSVTFIEEKSDTGTRWLIVDSNLHIQFPLPPSWNNLASNTLDTTSSTTTTKTDTETATKPTDNTTQPLVTVPVVNKTDTPTKTTAPDLGLEKTVSKWLSITTIIIITLGIVMSIGLWVFWLMKWRRKNNKIAPAMAAVGSVALAASLPEVASSSPVDAPTILAPTLVDSNVVVSTVEEIDNTPSSVPSESSVSIMDSAAEENSSPVPEVPTETISEDTALVVNETVESAPVITEETSPSAPVVEEPEMETILRTEGAAEESPELQPSMEGSMEVIPEEPAVSQENTVTTASPVAEEQNTTPETPVVEAPPEEAVATIFSQPEEATTQAPPDIKSLDQIINDSTEKDLFGQEQTEPSTTGEPHSLFESVFNPAPPKPETHGLFEDILKSGS